MIDEALLEQLREHCDELEIINQKVMEENEQLKAQIEKMECCYLCADRFNCAAATVFTFHCCDNWRLSE